MAKMGTEFSVIIKSTSRPLLIFDVNQHIDHKHLLSNFANHGIYESHQTPITVHSVIHVLK